MIKTSRGFRLLAAKFAIFYALVFLLLNYFSFAANRFLYSLAPYWMPLYLAAFFFLFSKSRLLRIEEFRHSWKDAAFLVLAALFILLRINSGWLYRDILGLIGFVFLGAAIFSFEALKFFLKEYRKETFLTLLFFCIYFAFYYFFQQAWVLFARTSALAVYFLLSITFSSAIITLSPIIEIGTKEFSVSIAMGCSGIESVALFVLLFFAAAAMEFNELNKKKLVFAFVIGVIGIYLLSILRLYLIIASGVLVSGKFAILVVHEYTALFLFLAFFLIFWFYSFKWARKKAQK